MINDAEQVAAVLQHAAAGTVPPRADNLSGQEAVAHKRRVRGAQLLRANKDVNLLAPVLLNACHKSAQGKPCTDLEQALVDAVRGAGLSGDQVAA